MHNFLSKFYYLPPTLFNRWKETKRARASKLCSRRRSALVRTESERERAEAVADAADRQGSLRTRDP